MIFISHQHSDKDFVGDIAQTLKDTFGEEKVFFDDWSIKPGENIVTKMDSGLKNCKYFLFFITHNSLKSEMVNLEWTSALMARSEKEIKFIPIRSEDVNVPTVISAIKYLDLYSDGIETIKTLILVIIQEQETNKRYPTYQDLQAYILRESENELKFFILAKKFFEPNGKFVLSTTLDDTQADFSRKNGLQKKSFNPNASSRHGVPENVFFLEIPEGIKKGFKEELIFTKKVIQNLDIALFHMKSLEVFEVIPTTPINSVDDIPTL